MFLSTVLSGIQVGEFLTSGNFIGVAVLIVLTITVNVIAADFS